MDISVSGNRGGPPASPGKEPTRQRSKRFSLKRVGLPFAVLVGLYLIVLLFTSLRLGYVYHRLKAKGYPVTLADVLPPQVPDTDNGAPLYERAWRAFDDPNYASREAGDTLLDLLVDLGYNHFAGKTTPEQDQQLVELLSGPRIAASVEFVREANVRPNCRFDLAYEEGPEIRLPHLSRMRNLSRMLCYRARYETEAGRPREAWPLVVDAVRIVRALRSEPFIISQFVRMSQAALAADAMDDACRGAPPSDEDRRTLEALLVELDDPFPMENAYHGERIAFGDWIYDRAYQMMAGSDRGVRYALLHVTMPYVQLDKASYIRFMTLMATRFDTAIWPREKHAPPASYYHFATLSLRSLAGGWRKYDGLQAQLRLMRIGLAVSRHRNRCGEWPKTLDELDTGDDEGRRIARLQDPMADDCFRYVSGKVVYSVGTNRRDDGAGQDEEGRDLDFCFWLIPESARQAGP